MITAEKPKMAAQSKSITSIQQDLQTLSDHDWTGSSSLFLHLIPLTQSAIISSGTILCTDRPHPLRLY